MYKVLFILLTTVFLSPSYGAKKKGDVVIINSNKNTSQNVVAPALVPSKARQLRSARKDAEFETEDIILQKLEAQRLKDEQKRLGQLVGGVKVNTAKTVVVSQAPVSSSSISLFDGAWLNKAFISFGLGSVQYPGAENINSSNSPAYFFSFGGYGYGNVIIDLTLYYSEHYITPVDNTGAIKSNSREGIAQPSLSMSTKFSPFKGRVKPYLGTSSVYLVRRSFIVGKSGDLIGDANPERDIAIKRWRQAFDAGLAVGADIGLGSRLGLNVDFRYHWNLYTESRSDRSSYNSNIQNITERDSVVVSANLRYYFN